MTPWPVGTRQTPTVNGSMAMPPGRIVRRVARRAGIGKRVGPHTLRHALITAALDAGLPLRDIQEAARRTMRYHRGRQWLDRHVTYIVDTFIARAAR